MVDGESWTAASWRSPKTEIQGSETQGRGVFATETIDRGELVAAKGGHLVDGQQLRQLKPMIGDAELQIGQDLYLVPRTVEEHDAVMMFLNHSCEPNAGVQGNILFVAMRTIDPGEEVTIDYAMIDDGDFEMDCHCRSSHCRGVIHGRDWMKPELQTRYRGYFSSYIGARLSAGDESSIRDS